jgi:hypothetical protein
MFPEQGCHHLICGLTATIDPSFMGSLIDGTPVSPDRFLFPGLVNLRFRRDFLAQIDPNQATTWLRSQHTEDHRARAHSFQGEVSSLCHLQSRCHRRSH